MIDSLVCTFSVLKKFPQAWKCFSKISSELLICRINHYTRINFSSTSELQKTPNKYQFSSVQSLSRVRLFVTPWTAARQASLSIIILESTQTHVHRVRDAIQPSRPLSSPSPPAPIPPSIRVFSNESTLRVRWPKYWSFSFSISPSKEHPGLISFRMDWLDLLAVQGTLKSLLQHHSSKPSILQCSAFFTE